MGKKTNTDAPVTFDCPTAATGDTVPTARPTVEAVGSGFRYIGPKFVTGCVVNGLKYDPQSWDEARAKAEIEREPFFSKYFQFPNIQNTESNEE